MNLPTDKMDSMKEYTATFFLRLAAYLLDLAIISVVISMVVSPIAIMRMLFPDFILFQNVFFAYGIPEILSYLIYKMYFIIFTVTTGTTIGKRAFHLFVVDESGNKPAFTRLLLREIVGRFLGCFFFWGYIMCFIDKNHRAFQDYLADTLVISAQKKKVIPIAKKNVTARNLKNGFVNPGENEIKPAENEIMPVGNEMKPDERNLALRCETADGEKKEMVNHIILWKLKEELVGEEKETVKRQIKEGLEGLKGAIPGLLDIKVITCGLETSNADLMLSSVFESKEALAVYANHPLHLEVANNVVRPNTASRVCLDYEE